MKIYDAIMKAADHIEANPHEFNFISTQIPSDKGCGTPGCALGWIGFFAGCKGSYRVASDILGIANPEDFYTRLTATEGPLKTNTLIALWAWGEWRQNAKACAKALRLYAAKYHAAHKIVGIPEAIRTIFTTPQHDPEAA